MTKLLLAGLSVLFVYGCSFGEKTDVMYECASPSGTTITTLYRVSTGDRPGDQEMKINVRPASSAFDDGMHSFAFRHGYDAVIRWHSDTQMTVEYPEYSEIAKQEQVIFGTSQTFSSSDQIRVEYQEMPSTHGHFMVEKRCFTRAQE
jgi:hypothetical protein